VYAAPFSAVLTIAPAAATNIVDHGSWIEPNLDTGKIYSADLRKQDGQPLADGVKKQGCNRSKRKPASRSAG
jgi:hypothetical protein